MTTRRSILMLLVVAALAVSASASAQEAPAKKDAPAYAGKTAGDLLKDSGDSEKTAPPTLPGLETLLRMVLWLGVIIVFIYVSVWLIRKYVPSARGVFGGGPLKIVTKMHVSAKQSIVLVKMGRRFVLVGVTPNSMTPLSEITDPEEAKRLTEDLAAGQDGHGSKSFRAALGEAQAEQAKASSGDAQVGEVKKELDDVRRKVSWWRGQSKS